MSQISQEMSSEYNRIQKRVKEDPGTAGDQGEENWAELLKDWIPSTYHVVTKGRIISLDGKTSPQIDVLVLKSSYPKKLISKKVYLAAGVAAAFECKITLKPHHITEALKNCIAIKKLEDLRKGSPFKELNNSITYGLLAHSHSWKKDKSQPIDNLENRLVEEDKKLVAHPRYMIDLVCVADIGTWASSKNSFLVANERFTLAGLKPPKNQSGKSLVAQTAYMKHTNEFEQQLNDYFTPIGALIFNLFEKLAWEDREYRSLADYFGKTIGGSSRGIVRYWTSDIYSHEIKTKLERNLMGIERSIFPNDEPWDEWQINVVP